MSLLAAIFGFPSARLLFWLSFSRVISQRRSNRVEASAKTTVWLARASQAAVRKLLDDHPGWWRYMLQPTLFYGDIALDIAADLLIADSERRCAAVLLRLSARRFADSDDPEPVDVSITQEDLAGAANLSRSSRPSSSAGWPRSWAAVKNRPCVLARDGMSRPRGKVQGSRLQALTRSL